MNMFVVRTMRDTRWNQIDRQKLNWEEN